MWLALALTVEGLIGFRWEPGENPDPDGANSLLGPHCSSIGEGGGGVVRWEEGVGRAEVLAC